MAGDYYLCLVDNKVGAVKGESVDTVYADEIQLNKFTIEVEGPDLETEGSSDSGHCDFKEAEFEAVANVASSTLFYLCCAGELLKTATLTCRKAGAGKQQTYLQWRFHNPQISSFKQTPTDNGLVVDTFRLKYAKVEIAYSRQKADGTVEATPHTAGWDADQNGSLKSTLPHPKK